MKNKILVILIAFAIIGGVAFGQTIEVTNKLSSDVVAQPAAKDASTTFQGFSDEVYGKITADRFTVEARYRLNLNNRTNPKYWGENVELYHNNLKANVWFRPMNGLEFAIGNDYGYSIPGSYLVVDDSNWGVGKYGANGLTGVFTGVPGLTIGISLPEQNITTADKMTMHLNAGINYYIDGLANIGASYAGNFTKDAAQGFGIFGDFVGVENLYISLGFTGYTKTVLAGFPVGDEFASMIGASASYQFGMFKIAADFTMNILDSKYEAMPMYIAGLVKYTITDPLYVQAAVTFNSLNTKESDLNISTIVIKPKVVYTNASLGEFGVGAEISIGMYGKLVGDGTYTGFKFPVYWKYFF